MEYSLKVFIGIVCLLLGGMFVGHGLSENSLFVGLVGITLVIAGIVLVGGPPQSEGRNP